MPWTRRYMGTVFQLPQSHLQVAAGMLVPLALVILVCGLVTLRRP
jgi:hypothetical protein